MQNTIKTKQLILLIGILLSSVWCNANRVCSTDGHSAIQMKESHVQGAPKGNTIQASISGHYLTVVFTENLGEVAIELTSVTGMPVEYFNMTTPNGYQFYITYAGDYIVTFTLPNGDVYYGEFTVTD